MRSYHVLAILLFTFCFIAFQSEISFGQVPCPGRLFGVPICTGFYLKLDTSQIHKRINKLEQNADSLLNEAAKLYDSIRRQSMPTFKNYGDEFQKQWQLNVPHDLHYPFDGSLHLPPIPIIPHLELEPPMPHSPYYLPPSNNIQQPWLEIDPTPGEDFFEPGVPHSPFYYNPPNNTRRMPSPKIEPFKKDEKKNPIRDFKGWYYEKVADIAR